MRRSALARVVGSGQRKWACGRRQGPTGLVTSLTEERLQFATFGSTNSLHEYAVRVEAEATVEQLRVCLFEMPESDAWLVERFVPGVAPPSGAARAPCGGVASGA